jgi:hypothetical protein
MPLGLTLHSIAENERPLQGRLTPAAYGLPPVASASNNPAQCSHLALLKLSVG